jgi:hypothetical protein
VVRQHIEGGAAVGKPRQQGFHSLDLVAKPLGIARGGHRVWGALWGLALYRFRSHTPDRSNSGAKSQGCVENPCCHSTHIDLFIP